jgi:hypothetical protein
MRCQKCTVQHEACRKSHGMKLRAQVERRCEADQDHDQEAHVRGEKKTAADGHVRGRVHFGPHHELRRHERALPTECRGWRGLAHDRVRMAMNELPRTLLPPEQVRHTQ